MSETRLIKKYPNRRLYDTKISRYITLSDIKELIVSYSNFKVIDAKSGDDLTRSTLVQIIADQENNSKPLLTDEILKEFVRFYGDSMQAMMSRFLEHSVKLFMKKRAGLKSPLNTILCASSSSIMHSITEQNIQTWEAKENEELNSP